MQLLLEALTYHRDSAGPLSVLVILLVRVTLVLLTTLLFGRLFSRASAAVQHRVWLLGLLGTLAVPALWAATPGWRMPLLVLKVQHLVSPPAAAALPGDSSPWIEILAAVWLTGTLIGVAYLLVGIASARRTFCNSLPCDDPQWLGALGEARRDTATRSPVQLRTTTHVAAPAVWSLWRIRILVPAATESWTLAQRRSVLIHELTHARRRDCWSQLLASLVCAVWWFHPLTWYASARLRLLAEQAADDGVLRAGTGRTDYAGHLLSIASSLGRSRLVRPTVLRVTGSHLERRIRAILDPTRMRYPLRDHHARLGWLVGSMLLIALATCSPSDVRPLAQQAGMPMLVPGRIDLRLRLHSVPMPDAKGRKTVVIFEPVTTENSTMTVNAVKSEYLVVGELELIALVPMSVARGPVGLIPLADPQSVCQLLPNWEVGRDACLLIPNFVPGMAKTVLVSPSLAGESWEPRTKTAPAATATTDMLSVR